MHGNCVLKVAMMLQQEGGRYGNSVSKMSMMLQHFNMLLRRTGEKEPPPT